MLAALERELGTDQFLVIGIHSPKFSSQRDPEMVRAALGRLGVTHPVVHDPDSQITQSFAVRGWPTMIIVDPDGYLFGTIRGEPEPQALLLALRQVLDEARRRGMLTGGPLPVRPEPEARRRLAYPGDVIAGASLAGDRSGIYVADTGHHQVAIYDAQPADARGFELTERTRLGAGRPGLRDGPAAEAELRGPYGMALAGPTLYIADTANHAVRAVDLPSGQVATVAGARPPASSGGEGPAGEEALRSPWGLAWDGRRLFIAAAGVHQIWVFDPATGRAGPFAGTGAEGSRDGLATEAWFAQPSGLALLEGVLYVVDSETSSIRAIADLDDRPRVRTVCGSGDLFGFGDSDGDGPAAELQHPLGITAGGPGDRMLYVADSFNHKIRSVDPATGSCRTLFGGGGPELDAESAPGTELAPARPGVPAFCEPEGLAWRDGELLVADTGNHRILGVRLADGTRRVLIGG